MSNRAKFGRDAEDFLRQLGFEKGDETDFQYGTYIKSMTACGGDRTTVRVLISNRSGREEREFVIMNAHAERFALSLGAIDEELLCGLEYFAEVAKAYGSACSSFAFTPSSYSALYKKLLAKGFAKDVSADAIDCMRDGGFVKEDEIALRRAQIFVGKRWGKTRIYTKLREEGFDDSSLGKAHQYLDRVDFAEICAEHIRKKYGNVPEDDHSRRLMYASIARMGFSGSEIREALKLI